MGNSPCHNGLPPKTQSAQVLVFLHVETRRVLIAPSAFHPHKAWGNEPTQTLLQHVSRVALFRPQRTCVQVRGRSSSVKRNQMVLWIRVAEKGSAPLDPRPPRFPAILDIGCNDNFLINERHWHNLSTERQRSSRKFASGKHAQDLAAWISQLKDCGNRLLRHRKCVWQPPFADHQRQDRRHGTCLPQSTNSRSISSSDLPRVSGRTLRM